AGDASAVVASRMPPPCDGDRLPEVAFVDATAIVSAFQDNLQLGCAADDGARCGRPRRPRRARASLSDFGVGVLGRWCWITARSEQVTVRRMRAGMKPRGDDTHRDDVLQ